jgi:protein TonB
MLTETTPLYIRRSIDSRGNRLPWTLRTSLLIWAVAVWALFMEKPSRQPLEPPQIEVRIIEQSVPASKQNIKVEQPAASHKAKPLPLPKPQPAHTAPQDQEMTPDILTAAPGAASPGALAVPGGVQSANPSANRGTHTGSDDGKGKSGHNIYANSGARVIIRPMPQIPDDLREGAFNSSALARFHVAADGSAEVELARPTPDPRLNHILLDSLKKWRFMPAIKNGKPMASTEEIVIKIEVK